MPQQSTEPTVHRRVLGGPLVWDDVREVSDRLGIRPIKDKESKRSREAATIHAAYTAWVDQQGIRPGLRYVMSLQTLYMFLTERPGEQVERREHWQRARQARVTIVNALNDPRSGLELTRRPVG